MTTSQVLYKSQPTDLFCRTIFFAKFNMLTSFSLHFLANVQGDLPTHDFPVEQGQRIPHKVWRDLFLKKFHGKWRTFVCGKSYWGLFYIRRLMIRSYQDRGSFTNIFFIKNFHFFNHERIYV